MRLVAIRCWGSMISLKTWLERVSNFFIGYSSVGGVSGVLVDFMLFRICFVCPFDMAMERGGCFIRSTVSMGHVVKWDFLMDWSKVLLTWLNIVS